MFDFIEDAEVRAKVESTFNETLQDKISSSLEEALERETKGLKDKNLQLLQEKKELAKTLSEVGDPEAAKAALKFLEENEDAQLIKDGKIEELINKKTSSMKTDFESTLGELKSKLEEAESVGTTYKSMFERKVVEDELRDVATRSGVRDTAVADILLRANNEFSLGEDGSVEARDKDGNLRNIKEDIIMTPKNWVESLKTTHPHYWPESAGAGATGDAGSAGDVMAKLADLAARGKTKEYNALRMKMLNKKK